MGYDRKRIVYAIDGWADRIFTPKYNPLHWLGTLCFFCMMLILISGIYLFLFYKTGTPYESVQYLTVEQWYIGGIMRSVHRYASDGLVMFMALHLLREFLLGRYRQWRWLSWFSGNALLIISIIIGIIGYWMVWDGRAQLIAQKTAQLLNDIPILVEPPSRSFLSDDTISKMLFFVLLLAHIGISLIGISAFIFIHVSRNARAAIKPPRVIAVATLIVLFILSFIAPATNAQTADMAKLPINIPFDWFFLFIYPLASVLPKWVFWFTSVGGVLIVFMAPWLGRSRRLPPAQIILEKCVGCEQCNKDCPYEAIRMAPRKDGRPYLLQAEIMVSRCASCGICIGSCDSKATNLPDRTLEQIENEITELLHLAQRQDGKPKILGFICEKSVKLDEIVDTKNRSIKGMPNVPIITFRCAGMIQHSIIEHALESGADGVFVSGCQMEECYYREGAKWANARLMGERAPVLLPFKGPASNYSRIRVYWLSPLSQLHGKDLISEINLFRDELSHISNVRTYGLIKPAIPRERIYKKAMAFSAASLLLIPAFLILFLSTKPTYPFYSKDQSLLKFTFKRSGKQVGCRELAEEEVETKLKHMRKTRSSFARLRMECDRRRLPMYVEVYLDNKNIFSKTYYPTGIRKDGSTFAYEEIPIVPGVHDIKVKMRDLSVEEAYERKEVEEHVEEHENSSKMGASKDDSLLDYTFEKKINIKAEMSAIIDFDEVNNKFYVLGQNEE